MALFDKNMTVGKSKYLVTLYPYDLLQPLDKNVLGGKLNLERGRGGQLDSLLFSNLSKKNTRLQNLRSYFTRNLKEIHFDKKCQGEIQHLKFKNLDSTS